MVFDEECRKNRQVKKCEKCCRFKNCRDHTETELTNDRGCERLGYAIIVGVAEEYEKAYRQGKVKRLANLRKWFTSQQTEILSAEKYSGQAILDALDNKCRRKYGNINDIWERKRVEGTQKIASLKERLKSATSFKEKYYLTAKINAVKGELNE